MIKISPSCDERRSHEYVVEGAGGSRILCGLNESLENDRTLLDLMAGAGESRNLCGLNESLTLSEETRE